MGDTKIQWTGKTWNPIRARNKKTGKVGWFCEHVSEGCRNCYAEKMNRNTYFGNGLDYKPAALDQVELFLDEEILKQPLRWRKPTKVFPCSMTDAFARFVPDEWLDSMMAVAALASQHTFQFLTKRADRALEYMTRLSKSVEPLECAARAIGYTLKFTGLDGKQYGLLPWPIPNVWLGVSVEDQKNADERISLLLKTPTAVRWISAEPLLGPINLLNAACGYDKQGYRKPLLTNTWLDWIVVGGESGPNARSMQLEWVQSLIRQCKSAGVPVFVKQLGSSPVAYEIQSDEQRRPTHVTPLKFNFKDNKGGDITEWPIDLQVREFPSVVTPKDV